MCPPALAGAVPLAATRTRLERVGARAPLGLIAFGVFLYSTGPVIVAASSVSGPVFSFWRLWFGVAVLGVLTLGHRHLGGHPSPRRGWWWACAAGVMFALHQLFFMTALKLTSVVDVSLVGTLSPIVTGLLAVPMFGERPGVRFRLWSLVAMAGAAVVVLAGSSGPDGDPLGMGLALGNVVWFSLFFLFSKKGRDHIAVVPFLFGVIAVAAVFVSGFVAATGAEVTSATSTDLLYAALAAVVPGTLGHFVMTWPLRRVAANIPPVMRLGTVVLASVMAWVFLGEPVEVAHLLGGVLTFAGVAGALLSPAGRSMAAAVGREETLPEA